MKKKAKEKAAIVKAASKPTNLTCVLEEDSYSSRSESGDEEGDDGNSVHGVDDEPDDEVPLEDQELIDIDEEKIVKEHYDKICNSAIFEGFIPSD